MWPSVASKAKHVAEHSRSWSSVGDKCKNTLAVGLYLKRPSV